MDISEEVLVALRQIIRATDLHSRYLAKEFGLTGPQLLILIKLSQSNPISVGEIAKIVSLSQATVTDILDRLALKGLIRRERSSEDKRRMTVRLTEQGADVLKSKPSPLQEDFINRFSSLEDWEQSSILSSLQRVAAMMRADVITASPVLSTGPIPKSDEREERFLPAEDGDDKETRSKAKGLNEQT
jgi:DNA-binding MarR family transcriptional regulator